MTSVFVQWSVDDVDEIEQHASTPESIDRLRQKMEQADRVFISWANSHQGTGKAQSFPSKHVGNGIIEIGMQFLDELNQMRRAFRSAAGPVSVGVGHNPEEAQTALELARAKGGNRSCIYSSQTEAVLTKLREHRHREHEEDPLKAIQPSEWMTPEREPLLNDVAKSEFSKALHNPFFTQAAFRDSRSGKVVGTGPFHNIYELPEEDPEAAIPHYEAGFIGADGFFYNRHEAAAKINRDEPAPLQSEDLHDEGLGRPEGQDDLGGGKGLVKGDVVPFPGNPNPRKRRRANAEVMPIGNQDEMHEVAMGQFFDRLKGQIDEARKAASAAVKPYATTIHGTTLHDYSHLLHPLARQNGYKIDVHYAPNKDGFTLGRLLHNGVEVANNWGYPLVGSTQVLTPNVHFLNGRPEQEVQAHARGPLVEALRTHLYAGYADSLQRAHDKAYKEHEQWRNPEPDPVPDVDLKDPKFDKVRSMARRMNAEDKLHSGPVKFKPGDAVTLPPHIIARGFNGWGQRPDLGWLASIKQHINPTANGHTYYVELTHPQDPTLKRTVMAYESEITPAAPPPAPIVKTEPEPANVAAELAKSLAPTLEKLAPPQASEIAAAIAESLKPLVERMENLGKADDGEAEVLVQRDDEGRVLGFKRMPKKR